MTKSNFAQTALNVAPIAIPICAISGGIIGALSGGSIALNLDFLGFTSAVATVAGVPTGLFFWAMQDTSASMQTVFALMLLLVCFLAFLALFIPVNCIANL